MFRGILVAALLLAGCASGQNEAQQQVLVDRATLAVQEVMTAGDRPQDATDTLKRARAALVCPRFFRAGFIFGGEGGACVLSARDGSGSWSSPAFYSMGAASFGLQAGITDASLVVLVMNDRALTALLRDQVRFGGDANLTFATFGAGIGGGTTAAAGADYVALAQSRGLFAGLSLQGSYMNYDAAGARAYYGRDATAQQIVIDMAAHNPAADPLRAMLMRFGNRQ
ncbi:lipid-binding SYLF domain-containing protein [Falsiroseomonas sp. HW251]|uniref:lipid-binding SYLF domain-containing protein n=1 Tax=Falsiroseomonas sp. HW251 TaxID=3390998 RepID=UPI003D31D036